MDQASDPKLILWVRSMLRRRMLLGCVGAVVCFLIGLGVLWLTWWAVRGILWFSLATLEPSALLVDSGTWIVFALLFVAYFTANWDHLEKVELESPARLRVARAVARLTDSPFLALAGPKTMGTFVRAVSIIALVGPATMMTSWKLLQQSVTAWRAASERVAEVLQTLATAGVRLPLEELTRLDPSDRMPTTFAAVRLFDGIILRSSEPVGLVMSDSLRNAVLAHVPATQRDVVSTKAPPVRVSLKGSPKTPPPSAKIPSPPPRSAAPSPKPSPALPKKMPAPVKPAAPPSAKPAPPAPKAAAPPANKSTPAAPPAPSKPKPRPKPPQ